MHTNVNMILYSLSCLVFNRFAAISSINVVYAIATCTQCIKTDWELFAENTHDAVFLYFSVCDCSGVVYSG